MEWPRIIFFSVLIILVLLYWLTRSQLLKQREIEKQKVEIALEKHLHMLARRKMAILAPDHYGVRNEAAWLKEYKRFVQKALYLEVYPQDAGGFGLRSFLEHWLHGPGATFLQGRIDKKTAELTATTSLPDSINPLEFENWVAQRLVDRGWTASATKASGDQGADVIAQKGNMLIVIQCKLYNTPVGNKAVQEAHAAKSHYAASISAVVTNSTYTPSAMSLAATTGVLLLHHSDLLRLDEVIRPSG